jgi:hypothetical protein
MSFWEKLKYGNPLSWFGKSGQKAHAGLMSSVPFIGPYTSRKVYPEYEDPAKQTGSYQAGRMAGQVGMMIAGGVALGGAGAAGATGAGGAGGGAAGGGSTGLNSMFAAGQPAYQAAGPQLGAGGGAAGGGSVGLNSMFAAGQPAYQAAGPQLGAGGGGFWANLGSAALRSGGKAGYETAVRSAFDPAGLLGGGGGGGSEGRTDLNRITKGGWPNPIFNGKKLLTKGGWPKNKKWPEDSSLGKRAIKSFFYDFFKGLPGAYSDAQA